MSHQPSGYPSDHPAFAPAPGYLPAPAYASLAAVPGYPLPAHLASAPAASTAAVRRTDRRPRVVTAAFGLMVGTAAVSLLISALTAVAIHHFNRAYEANVAPVGAAPGLVRDIRAATRTVLAGLGVGTLIGTLMLGVLAFGVLRGNAGARIGAWVLAAFGVVCSLATVCGAIVAKSTVTVADAGYQAKIAGGVVRAAQESVPGWFGGVIGTLSGVNVLGYIAVAVVLSVPAAKPFFHAVIRPLPSDH